MCAGVWTQLMLSVRYALGTISCKSLLDLFYPFPLLGSGEERRAWYIQLFQRVL